MGVPVSKTDTRTSRQRSDLMGRPWLDSSKEDEDNRKALGPWSHYENVEGDQFLKHDGTVA